MSYVLIIEDNPNDIVLMKRVLIKDMTDIEAVFISDGEEAVSFIDEKETKNDLPVCILLDIKMPKKNGLQILDYIRNVKQLWDLKVIIFSSSDRTDEKEFAMKLKCNEYVEKPKTYIELKKEIPRIIKKWS